MNDRRIELFRVYGNSLTKHQSSSEYVGLRRFKSFFGVSPRICATAWHLIKSNLSADYHEIHLLWALLFLKCYNTESINRAIVGCDEKTFRKRIWEVIDKLALIKVVEWDERKVKSNPGQTCFVSLDGVDFEIEEPKPFSVKWYSHKINGPGLRCEIGLCIKSGYIVWANGSYPCGSWPDLKLARDLYTQFLEPNERSIADKGYNDPRYFILPNAHNEERHKAIMSRHETINKRIKQFNVLNCTFRHKLEKHKNCFHAIVNLTQLVLKHEDPLFSV